MMPSGIASSSGDFSGSFPAWQAFDGEPGTAGDMWLSEVNIDPAWLAYQFTDGPRTVLRYGVQYTNGASLTTRAPRDWEFQGSTDGSTWMTLNVQSGQTGWISGEVRTFAIAAPTAFTHHRLFITADNDSRGPIVTVHVGELFMEGF